MTFRFMCDSPVPLLESLLPEMLDWLERWVRLNSFTANPAGVRAVAESTVEAFASLGFTAELVPSREVMHGPHLFLRRPVESSARSTKPLLLVTHLDTVFPPEEEARENFHWRPEPTEGRIYGPGTVDIKGGTALIWLVLKALAVREPEAFATTEWIIAANASEEVMSADFAERTRERCPAARAVLVFEGGRLDGRQFTLVTGRKGKADFRVRASGRAAHAGSQHHEGVNAITALAAVVPTLATLTDPAREVTLNIGRIEGGTVVNRVPHEAELQLETRAFSPQALAETIQAIHAVAGPSPAVPGAVLEVESLGETAAWPGGMETEALFSLFTEAAAEQCASVVSERRGGLSDANYLCHLGPTLDGLGPSGGCAHCSERSADGSKTPEFVETTSFVPKAALVLSGMCRLLEPPPGA